MAESWASEIRLASMAPASRVAFCKAEGKTPNKPFKGSFNIRIPQDLHQRAALYSEEHNLKLNAVVQEALREYLTHAD